MKKGDILNVWLYLLGLKLLLDHQQMDKTLLKA